MHIGIDGYEINAHKLVGVGVWGLEIIKKLYWLDDQNSYIIYLPSSPQNLPPERINWKYRIIPSLGFWTFTSLPFGIWSGKKLNVFFSPTHYIPRFVNIPRVVSIMDLSYLHYPEMFLPKDLYQLKNWTDYSIKNSQKIITISQFTKSEIVKYYSVSPDKIVVVYPGLNEIYLKKNTEKPIIPGNYLLFIGTIQPRKNIERLIDAFAQGPARQNSKLVIVGKKGWLYQSIFAKVKKLNLENKVQFLDYIPETDMPNIYQNAKAFILQSFYEGFGIPVVEAMASGIPTIISNTSSLPEVGGKASIYVDPDSVDSIKNGIIKALTLKDFERKKLIQAGFAQIKKFSYRKSAEIVLKTLKDIK